MQHRIFLVPLRARLPRADAIEHWVSRHAKVFGPTPGLRRYVQNRPLAPDSAIVCSETWFDNRDSERAAYASAYYENVVTPDEELFLDRAAAWSARVAAGGDVPHPHGMVRVLWFGAQPLKAYNWASFQLSRTVQAPGSGTMAHSMSTADPEEALAVVAASRGQAFACRPTPIIPGQTDKDTP